MLQIYSNKTCSYIKEILPNATVLEKIGTRLITKFHSCYSNIYTSWIQHAKYIKCYTEVKYQRTKQTVSWGKHSLISSNINNRQKQAATTNR